MGKCQHQGSVVWFIDYKQYNTASSHCLVVVDVGYLASTNRALHLNVHPSLQTVLVKHMVARRHHAWTGIAAPSHRHHADGAVLALERGGDHGHAAVVVVLVWSEAPRDEEARALVVLYDKDCNLQADPGEQCTRERVVGLRVQEVVRARECIQRDEQPGPRHANDVPAAFATPHYQRLVSALPRIVNASSALYLGSRAENCRRRGEGQGRPSKAWMGQGTPNQQRLPVVVVNVVDNLRQPEAVDEEDENARVSLHLVYQDDAGQEAAVEPGVQHGELPPHRIPPLLEALFSLHRFQCMIHLSFENARVANPHMGDTPSTQDAQQKLSPLTPLALARRACNR